MGDAILDAREENRRITSGIRILDVAKEANVDKC